MTDKTSSLPDEALGTPPGLRPPPTGATRATAAALPMPIRVDKNTVTVETAAGTRILALFGSRLSAALLDLVILTVVSVAVSPLPYATPIAQALGFIYYVGLIGLTGATWGMQAVGLRVVTMEGGKVRLFAAAVRHIIPFAALVVNALALDPTTTTSTGASASPFAPLATLLVGLWLVDTFWMTWDARRQTLHDKLAHTYVIRVRK